MASRPAHQSLQPSGSELEEADAEKAKRSVLTGSLAKYKFAALQTGDRLFK